MKHINITIRGKVQGVFFRATAKAKADELGLKGIVRNLPDGNVYIEAEGATDKLFQFTMWCYYGPSEARVQEVKTEDAEMKNFDAFRIDK